MPTESCRVTTFSLTHLHVLNPRTPDQSSKLTWPAISLKRSPTSAPLTKIALLRLKSSKIGTTRSVSSTEKLQQRIADFTAEHIAKRQRTEQSQPTPLQPSSSLNVPHHPNHPASGANTVARAYPSQNTAPTNHYFPSGPNPHG